MEAFRGLRIGWIGKTFTVSLRGGEFSGEVRDWKGRSVGNFLEFSLPKFSEGVYITSEN